MSDTTLVNTLLVNSECEHRFKASCANCRMAGICLPISLGLNDIHQLEQIIQRGRPLHKSDSVYQAGEAFRSIYAVHSGAIKTIKVTEDGIEQITGFYFPGDIIGLDGLATNTHSNSAIALDTASICVIPYNELERLSVQIPSLQQRFIQLMGKEIVADQQLITLLSQYSAEERIAAFLMNISARNTLRGVSATELFLPMSRSDISNYLGLTLETVSRVFARMHKAGILEIDKKHITINSLDSLSLSATCRKN